MTRIFLVRHGRTALNAEGRYRGLEDPPLDPTGRDEARGASERLAAEPVGAVYASPLRRAIETAEALATPHGLHVEIEPRLIDIDYGPWTALTQDEAAARDPDLHEAYRIHPLDAGTPVETVASVAGRISTAVRQIAARHEGGVVTAVSHDVPIRALVSTLLGYDGERFWTFPLPTCSITEIRATGGDLSIEELPAAPG